VTKHQSWTERLFRVFSNEGIAGSDEESDLGAYSRSRNAIRVKHESQSLFGESLVVERKSSISINSAFGLSDLRQNVDVSGSGSTDTTTPGKIIIQTGATAGSMAEVRSAEVGQYAPGYGAEIGVGWRLRQALTGDAFARWGGISSNGQQGLYFRAEPDAVYVVRRKDGVEVDRIEQSDWNVDRLDGTGGKRNRSKVDLDLLHGGIFQVDFTWYGYGIIVFGVIDQLPESPDIQRFIACHAISVADDISISEPNLQIFAEIDNGTQATDFKADLGGMQYAVVGGKGAGRQRVISSYRTGQSTSTTPIPVMSWDRKSTFVNRSVELDSLELSVAGETHIFEVFLGGTASGGTGFVTPVNHNADETGLEVEDDATGWDATGATCIYQTLVQAGQGSKPGEKFGALIDLDLPDNGAFTMTARTLTGTGSISYALMRFTEGW